MAEPVDVRSGGIGCSRIVEDPNSKDASANEISVRAWKEAKVISTLIFYP